MTTIFSRLDSSNVEIVRENYAILGLEDGKVYVLAAHAYLFVDAVKTNIKHFKEKIDDSEDLIYHYDVCAIEDFNSVIRPGLLYDAIKKGVNIIIPISTPNVAEKLYIVAKSEAALLDMYIPSMVMQAENITKKAIEDALINLAVQESESCNRLLDDVYQNNVLSEFSDNLFGGSFEQLTCLGFLNYLDKAIPKDTSYKKSREIISRFVENCKFINRTEKKKKLTKAQVEKLQQAHREVNYVFDLFSPNLYAKFMLQMMGKTDIAMAFDNCINRDKIAANSKIVVSVDLVKPDIDANLDPKIAKKLKTNGKFRVYLSDGVKTVQVKFGRTASCIVYIMYLLDRKRRGDEIDTLKIVENEELFCNLYRHVYGASDDTTKAKFNTFTTKFDGEAKRSRLTDCYSDIRKALDESVSEFGESSLPFYIPNEYSHITILSSNISIHESFENVSFVY